LNSRTLDSLPDSVFLPIKRYLEGWWLTITLTIVILLIAAAITFGIGGSDGARAAIRFTARTSTALFLLAFTASALYQFWPGRVTRWIRQNRRYLGVSFAGSHGVHALAITAFVLTNPILFHEEVPPIGLVVNGIGYAFIVAMAATSFDRTAALIGPTAWRWLHVVGGYVIWLVFAKSYFPRAVHSFFYVPFAAVLVVAMMVRLVGSFKRRSSNARIAAAAVQPG